MATVPKQIDVGSDYKEKYGFFVPEEYVFKAKRGLNPEIVKEISWMKKEPEWMLKMRLRSLEIEFRNGAVYRYLGVETGVYDALLKAPSKARFYDQNIRHKYRSVHVRRRSE